MYNAYVIILYTAAVISFTVASTVWKRRNTQGAKPLIVLLAALCIWCLFQALSFTNTDFNVKLIFANLRYFGIEAGPIAFYALAVEYLSKDKVFGLKSWVPVLVFPFICIVSIWTNRLHYLFYLSVSMKGSILYLENGPIFWANMVYLYFFITAGVVLFIKSGVNTALVYRRQSIIMAVAAAFPIVANLTFNFGLLPFNDIDITPLAFLLSGLLFFYALFYLKLLDVVPVARDRLIEEMEDAVIVLDKHKRILDLNKRARALIKNSSVTELDYIGKDIKDVFGGWRELTDYISESGGVNERIIYHSMERLEYYHLRISNINDKKGEKYGELIVLRNITELEEAFQEARSAREEAVNANKSKDFFLANMSHEIRTPMNAIIGIAEILEINDFPAEKQKYYIEMILNSAQSLMALLNDILDFSKIEAGKMELEKSPFDMKKLITEMTDIFSVTASSKSLMLSSRINGDIGGILIGDYTRVRQILSNLLGNAIKFTSNGYINLSVEQVKKEGNRVFLGIAVEDSGVGIPEEKLGTIFESFRQADSTTTRKFGGTGLGLSIVKSLVELMGGQITADSKPEKGSRFSCIIPFELAEETAVNAAEPVNDKDYSMALDGLRLLVAEDNRINREIIGLHLKKLGCAYDFAETGAAALEKLEQNEYDAVLMDVQMPEMDGLEATRRIRALEQATGEHLPIIALTAGAMKSDVESCINAGMDGHLSKPVRIQSVYNTLTNYCKK